MVSTKDNQLPNHLSQMVREKLAYANSTIPFLSTVVSEIDQLANECKSIRTRLGAVDLTRHLEAGSDLYSDELRAVENSADELCERLAECYQELKQVEGVRFEESRPQYVDFPLETEFGLIHFCWRLGETAVLHWHWSDETCEVRKTFSEFENLSDIGSSLLA